MISRFPTVNSKDDCNVEYITLRKRVIKKAKRRSKSIESLHSKQFSKMTALNMSHALKIIPEFNGNREQLHKFICCCDIVYKTIAKNEEQIFLNVVKVKLTDLAYDVVKYNTYETWNDLKEKLKSQFGECRSISHIQFELLGTKQFKSEDIPKFASRVQKLISELNDACINDQGEDAAETIKNLNANIGIRCFQEGLLNQSVKLLVKACRFTDIGDAIEKACEEEIIQKHSSRNYTESIFKSNSNSFNRNSSYRSNFPNQPNSNSPSNSSSYNRNSSSFNSQSSQFNYNKPSSSRSILTCAYCKYKGHHISECRKKQYSDSMKRNQNQLSENLKELDQSSSTAVRVQELKK